MSNILRLVLDVMKPFEPNIVAFADTLARLEGVSAVNIALMESDREVENIKITIEGERLSFDIISEQIRQMAGAVHSIDMVASGKMIIEATETPQDA